MADAPLRILYVITDLQVGGVPLHLLRLAGAVHRRGHVVQVVSLARPGPVADRLVAAGIAVRGCQPGRRHSPMALWRLRQEMIRFRPDVVHALLFHANLASRLVGPSAGIPPRKLICEIQTVEIERRWHLRLDRWTHGLCRLEIGNALAVVDHLHTAGIPRRKLALVETGIDIAPFAAATALPPDQVGIPGQRPLVLWVGRLDPVKGLDDLLDAFSIVRRHHDAHLVLLGDGPEGPRLARRSGEPGLAGCVTWAGVRADVPRWLKSCDLFVFPSRTEGRPNALIEAMAAGCAIVCTAIPGNLQLITHERNALTVPMGDVAALASGIRTLLGDPQHRRRLGTQAALDARNLGLDDSKIQQYLDLYRA